MSYDKYFEAGVNALLEKVVINFVSPSTFKTTKTQVRYILKSSLNSLLDDLDPYVVEYNKGDITMFTMKNV